MNNGLVEAKVDGADLYWLIYLIAGLIIVGPALFLHMRGRSWAKYVALWLAIALALAFAYQFTEGV